MPSSAGVRIRTHQVFWSVFSVSGRAMAPFLDASRFSVHAEMSEIVSAYCASAAAALAFRSASETLPDVGRGALNATSAVAQRPAARRRTVAATWGRRLLVAVVLGTAPYAMVV